MAPEQLKFPKQMLSIKLGFSALCRPLYVSMFVEPKKLNRNYIKKE